MYKYHILRKVAKLQSFDGDSDADDDVYFCF